MAQVITALLTIRHRLADWEIGPGELRLEDTVLGCGSTSIVYLGYLRSLPVAVKECNFAQVEEQYGSDGQGTIIAFIRELEVWPEVDHPNILRFLGFCFSEDCTKLRIISQLCRGGTLFDLLHNRWDVELSKTQKLRMLVDIGAAVEYLHNIQMPIMHRDLKSLNVYIVDEVVDETSEVKVKLADFGFARVRPAMTGWSDLTSGAGTPHWMAPEVSQGSGYHLKADVFSFAVIMYEVVCRHMAFEMLDPEEVQQQIAQGDRPALYGTCGRDTNVPDDTPEELRQLIARCWSQSASERPSMDVAVKELRSLSWE
mmetsp:Transcript_21544/g.61690  ORF Transcript_21544/g.61690 Transcript_21544/m.61690 type:complete len:313 (+) Transcript_21544:125-1063(+)